MKKTIIAILLPFCLLSCRQEPSGSDTTGSREEELESIIEVDRVWAGHPVGFFLLTHENRQYIAYYNADRSMVMGQRDLEDPNFDLHVMPRTYRETARGTSTVLGWDSHNRIKLAVDRDGYIHMSGNMHVHPLTYFRSARPHDISTLEQIFSMVGEEEYRCTYPKFTFTRDGDLMFQYRDGSSGNGNEIYNIYDTETKQWSRMLDVPLTDGQGLMNAYQTSPTIMEDGWYHVYWVWRDTPDCATNHDLSYMKSPDLKQWYNAFGEPFDLPATLDKEMLIVDPVPAGGGLLNLAAELVLDENHHPVFAYHKYDSAGNIQFFVAYTQEGQWLYKQVTDWDYRWEFSGGGSINRELILKDFGRREDGQYELSYWHIKYGDGTLLLDEEFSPVGMVEKPQPVEATIEVESDFPEMAVRTAQDAGKPEEPGVRYFLKWETLPRNRDRPRPEPWPEPSTLYLYKVIAR